MLVRECSHQNKPMAQNESCYKTRFFPPLVADLLTDPVTYIDNVFADVWKRLGVNTLISRVGLSKRSATLQF